MSKVYRYKLNSNIVALVEEFAKLHQYDNRKEYKEAWDEYLEEHKEEIKREENRLTSLGYEGDINDKMFKSGRYYYRNKPITKTKPKDRRKYISLSDTIVNSMSNYISTSGLELKPAEGYEKYSESNKLLIKEEIDRLKKEGVLSQEDILLKIKKSYKNRYFNMREKDNNNI
jgi:hypothetical protein|tara:strand:+ start:7524 stop:8039 length:516 start_codon:yes stop_codon:yes gene_type:complete